LKNLLIKKLYQRGRGGMVDTTDLNFEQKFVSSQIQKNFFLK
jgi:hypothetical protein